MKLPKSIVALLVLATMSFANIGTTGATAATFVTKGVVSDYCHKVKAKVIADCASKFTWIPIVSVDVAFDADGKIVDSHPAAGSGSKDQQAALQIIKAIDWKDATPVSAKRPLWLSIVTSKNSDDIAVTARDVDYGAYMALLQRRIKRAWFPPKGTESERVTVQFEVDGGGGMNNLKLHKGCGIAPADEAAMTAVKNAMPFDPLPDGSPDSVDIQFTFDYNVLNKGGSAASGAGTSSASNKGPGDGVRVSGAGGARSDDRRSDAASGASMFVTQGMKALERKDYQMAIQFFQSALAIDAENAVAKKSLSIAYTGFGSDQLTVNPDLALDSFHKAKKYWPENPMTPDTLEQATKIFGKPASTVGGGASDNDKAK